MATETAEGGQPDMILSGALAIPDLDELEEQVNEDGELVIDAQVDTEGGGGMRGGDDATDSTGTGGGGTMFGLAAEAGSDVATGGGKGSGMLGGILGGISKMTLLLGAVVAGLAMLEPIQAALGGILRVLEIFVVPLAMALSPLVNALSRVATDMVQFFRNPGESIAGAIKTVMEGVINALIGALNAIPGVNISKVNFGGDEKKKPGAGIQTTRGETAANSANPDEPYTMFDALMMGPLEDFLVGKQGRLLPPQPGLSDESMLQRRQDGNSQTPDNFDPDMVM